MDTAWNHADAREEAAFDEYIERKEAVAQMAADLLSGIRAGKIEALGEFEGILSYIDAADLLMACIKKDWAAVSELVQAATEEMISWEMLNNGN